MRRFVGGKANILHLSISVVLTCCLVVAHSAVSKEGQAAPRTGFFRFFNRSEVVVKQWNAETEDAADVADKDQEARLAMGKCVYTCVCVRARMVCVSRGPVWCCVRDHSVSST